MPTAHSLVAPTQKMSDDAPYRPSGSEAVGPQSIPPQNSRHVSHPPQMPAPLSDARAVTTRPGPGTPARVPPQSNVRSSTPPAGTSQPASPSQPPTVNDRQQKSKPPRASSRGVTPAAGTSLRGRAQTPAESVAAAPPSRRWGLILFVLLIDIGLAASGAWMLSQGLAN